MSRGFLVGLITAAITILPSSVLNALDYPSRPVVVITSTPAGNGPDVIARLIADSLGSRWKQSVVVDNRPGGRAIVATQAVTQAARDGYTLYVALGSTYTILPEIQPVLPFDLKRDLVSIGLVGEQPFIIAIDPKLGINSLSELIVRAKEKPDQIQYGTIRNSTPHLVMERLQEISGAKFALIPYPATTKAVADALGGRLAVLVESASGLAGAIENGGLKALAVTSRTRLPEFPHVPTVAELFPGFEGIGWFMLAAPTGTPETALQKLNDDLRSVLGDPKLQEKLAKLGTYVRPMSRAEASDFIDRERAMWGPVVRRIGLGSQ